MLGLAMLTRCFHLRWVASIGNLLQRLDCHYCQVGRPIDDRLPLPRLDKRSKTEA